MRKFVWLLVCAPLYAEARIVDRVAAIVNNQVITLSEVTDMVKRRPDLVEDLKSAEEAVREKLLTKLRNDALEQIIAERLLEGEIKKRDLRATELEIERAFEGMIQTNKTTREKFIEELKKRGMTVLTYRQELAKQLQRRLLLEVLFKPKIKVTDEDVKTFYTQNVNAVNADSTQYCTSIIMRQTPSGMKPDDVAAQKKMAEEILAKVKAGDSFEALAKQYSQDPRASEGGDIGCFAKGVMLADFEKPVMAMKKGETSAVIQTGLGFYIVRLNDIKGSGVLPFEKVKDQIRLKLMNDALERQVQRWVDEEKKKAFIDKKVQQSVETAKTEPSEAPKTEAK